MRVTRGQALAWRMARQFLFDGAASAEEVVGRLGTVPARSGDAELAVARRLSAPAPGEVARAVAAGRLLKTYAFRGATNYLSPADAGRYLALRAAGRQWELPSWVDFYGLGPGDWPGLREIVRGVVADGPVTLERLVAEVTAHRRFAHLGPAFENPSHTFLKPFAWQGDLCFGPERGTFQSPAASPWWGGVPDLEEAGPAAVAAYFDAYGPATPEHVQYWLGGGLSAGRKRITRWLAATASDLVEVTVDGETMLHAAKHADGLAAQAETTAVTLLPGHDQWVFGPGTADERIVPEQHRTAVTRGAGLVLDAGVVAGTWKAAAGSLTVSWFDGDPPRGAIEAEAERVAALLGRPLTVAIGVG